jgi:CopA family copper-resistance protein
MSRALFFVLVLGCGFFGYTQQEPSVEGNLDNWPVREYTLIIKEELVNKTGKEVKGMTVNGSIPGPTLEFTEGEYAVIYVKNEMNVETSIHWHGILLPNFFDGVPYLTTPPIKPGTTFKYEFPIKQSGTYWYHSHTMLQEQSGVFGSLVIHPKEASLEYDKELVLMLSDWTNEAPKDVLRTLKRGSEWYNIKKGTATPLNQVIGRGAFGAQLDFWRQRMEGADIADVFYPAFLINGEQSVRYPQFEAGEKVRLRIIDGSASTSFWLTFGGEDPVLVSADGLNVTPTTRNKTFIAVAETYDFIITVPQNASLEVRATAQDGSGSASAIIGKGEIIPAKRPERPDKIGMMMDMAKMKMKMGAHAIKFRPSKDERYKMKEEYGMKMDMHAMEDEKHDMSMKKNDTMLQKKMDHTKMDHSKLNEKHNMEMNKKQVMSPMTEKRKHGMHDMEMTPEFGYDYLKSPSKTVFNKDVPVKEILLNLTGNMQRYIWSLNGVPLSETDKIKINSNEVTRITFNNLTMMHHPMHLHGHFFRVLNKNGDYSPLKHTVNVPPMEQITIEFYGNEYGDWFFHCHILYHMMSGMTRIMSYETPRDPRMKAYPVQQLIDETNQWYIWGETDLASHMGEFNVVSSNLRNQFNLMVEYGWNQNIEAEITYDRYLHDYLRVFIGGNLENELEDSIDELEITAIAGIRYLTPYLFDLDIRIDNYLRPQIGVGREIMIFPRTMLFGNIEYQADFGLVNDLPTGINYLDETVWNAGIEYFLSKNFSLMGSYDNRFGAGGGLSIRF